MKASELIQRLAQQIAQEGDKDVIICANTGLNAVSKHTDVDYKPLGIYTEGKVIEIYSEVV